VRRDRVPEMATQEGTTWMRFGSVLLERPEDVTPDWLACVAALTSRDKEAVRVYLREHGPWRASERVALLVALREVPTLSEAEYGLRFVYGEYLDGE
jgi:hypothetical protein